ncbi:MAG TPA: 4'-phosphopantetheinyl transferase superfamily protein [Gemmatimonadaceae bacterium]|nr:4'-phosphopantetheinyl transferase superfamily protein [Gemmatimonadaceae bacterium]
MRVSLRWPASPFGVEQTPILLGDDEVHLWSASLHVRAERLAAYQLLLSADERERAARFRFDRDRDRYVVARATLRLLIARYLDEDPAALRFDYGEQGKPSIRREPGAGGPTLHFNLAHAGSVAVYGLTHRGPLGVDVERVEAMVDAELVAESHFAAEEQRTLRTVPEPLRMRAFFECWTRKEAFIKALGGGLSIPLASFAVDFRTGSPPSLRWVLGDPDASARWTLAAFEPADEHVGAMAVEATGVRIRCWRWDA